MGMPDRHHFGGMDEPWHESELPPPDKRQQAQAIQNTIAMLEQNIKDFERQIADSRNRIKQLKQELKSLR